MGWGKEIAASRQLIALAAVLALGVLTASCFQPLYGNHTLASGESVRDKLGAIDIPTIPAPNGTPESRLAVELRNQLMYSFNGGAGAAAPTHRLQVTLSSSITTIIVDVASGRPETQVENINATFTLVEIATKKVVLSSSTFAHASFDIPGTAQRFAQQRAWHDAEDRAVGLVVDNIRNRLASYFVAGT